MLPLLPSAEAALCTAAIDAMFTCDDVDNASLLPPPLVELAIEFELETKLADDATELVLRERDSAGQTASSPISVAVYSSNELLDVRADDGIDAHELVVVAIVASKSSARRLRLVDGGGDIASAAYLSCRHHHLATNKKKI